MTRSARAMANAALKADAAAEQLNAWLQQRGSDPDAGRAASGSGDRFLTDAVAAVQFDTAAAAEPVQTIGAKVLDDATPDRAGRAIPCEYRAVAGIPMRLPHTDWLHHRLVVSGPADALADFQADASGAGTIPWQLDGDRLAEDFFHLLAAPPAPQRRRLSLTGARELARQLREAVEPVPGDAGQAHGVLRGQERHRSEQRRRGDERRQRTRRPVIRHLRSGGAPMLDQSRPFGILPERAQHDEAELAQGFRDALTLQLPCPRRRNVLPRQRRQARPLQAQEQLPGFVGQADRPAAPALLR